MTWLKWWKKEYSWCPWHLEASFTLCMYNGILTASRKLQGSISQYRKLHSNYDTYRTVTSKGFRIRMRSIARMVNRIWDACYDPWWSDTCYLTGSSAVCVRGKSELVWTRFLATAVAQICVLRPPNLLHSPFPFITRRIHDFAELIDLLEMSYLIPRTIECTRERQNAYQVGRRTASIYICCSDSP